MKIRYIIILIIIFVILGVVYLIFNRPELTPKQQVLYVWDIKDSDLIHIKISLPREKKKRSFIKISEGDKFPWFFDDRKKTPIDAERWGGGIPLILSGPSADRIITENATDEQLARYGLTRPAMEITLTLTGKKTINIKVGDSTPNGNNYYVKAPGLRSVATVDFTWYQVLRNLVINPPYTKAEL